MAKVGVENERFQKLENAEHRLVQAEEQFNEFQEFIFSKFKAVQDQVCFLKSDRCFQLARVSKGLDDDRVAKEQAYDVKNKDQANLEVRFLNAIENEQSVSASPTIPQVRKDIEAKLVRAVEDKAALTKTELQKVVKARVDGIEQIHAGLSNDLPKIQDAIREETQERDEADSTVTPSTPNPLGHEIHHRRAHQDQQRHPQREEVQGGKRAVHLRHAQRRRQQGQGRARPGEAAARGN